MMDVALTDLSNTKISTSTINNQPAKKSAYNDALIAHTLRCTRRIFLSTQTELAEHYAQTVLASQAVATIEHIDFLLSHVRATAAHVSGVKTEGNLTDLAYCLSNYTKALKNFLMQDNDINTREFSAHIEKLKPTLSTLNSYYSWHFCSDYLKINSLLSTYYPSAIDQDTKFSITKTLETVRAWSGLSRLNLPSAPRKPMHWF